MNVAGFVAALQAAGLPAEWEDLRDTLWLAGVLAPAPPPEPEQTEPAREDGVGSAAPVVSAAPPVHPTVEPGPRPVPAPARPEPRRPSPPTAPREAPVGVFLPRPTSTATPGRPVRLAVTAPGLADTARITRQLRPLKRRGVVRGRPVVDEQATVERIAETGLWQPVLTSPLGRWLDLDVVLDDGPSMALWDRPASTLVELLARLGAFRRITVWRLDDDGRRTILRRAGQAAVPCDPRELIDPTCRSVVLLLSDGIGPGWRSGTTDRALAGWAAAGPVAIWQPLAPRLWRRTAMHVQRGVLGAHRPGQPTADYSVGLDRAVPRRTVGVPVVSSGQASLGEWARLLAVGGSAVLTLRVLSEGDPRPRAATGGDEGETDPEAVITRFRTESSATAMRLAVYFSAIPLTVETMRVAQEVMLPESSPSHLTEVFLGGLLRRLPSPGHRTDRVYDFVPGVREALLAAITRTEAREVLDRVADAAALPLIRRRGFRAVLDDPRGPGAADLAAMDRPFARVMRTVLGRLDGAHAQPVRPPDDPAGEAFDDRLLDDPHRVAGLPVELPPVRDATLIERVHHQTLTFGWPQDADAVIASVSAADRDPQDARTGASERVSHDEYVARGGMILGARLPSEGCSVHLVPVADRAGRGVRGPAVSLFYPGLLRLAYRVHTLRDKGQRPVGLTVRIVAETDIPGSPFFTLVHRPDRLPLHSRDGTALAMSPIDDPRAARGLQFRPSALSTSSPEPMWTAQVDGLVGYVRLFAIPSIEGPPMALLDPPVEELLLRPAVRPAVRPSP